MTQITPDQIMAQMRRLQSIAQSQNLQSGPAVQSPNNQFNTVLKDALNTVSTHQMNAADAAKKIEMGDGGVSLVKAVIASQKASVAFDAAVQVRNRVVSAYQDIMNMPI